MMLTTKGRYAVMAVVDIASQNNGDSPVVLADVARRQGITIAYLEQIVARLRNAGLLRSVRGPGGGYRLNMNIDNITVAHIIDAMEESIEMTRCGGRNPGCIDSGKKCKTHDLWSGLSAHIYSYLDDITIADICNETLDNTYNAMKLKVN